MSNYTEGLFWGRCLIKCVPTSASDEGKTVTITDGTNTWTDEIDDYEVGVEFEVPNRNMYIITMSDNGVDEFTTSVCLGYGEYAKIILEEGHEPIYGYQVIDSASGVMSNNDNHQPVGALAVKEMHGVNTFEVETTDWSANTDSSTNTDYPYVATISSALYSASSTPVWDLVGASSVITAEEKASADMVAVAIFDTTGITLYATDTPLEDLTLRVMGV